MSLTNFLEQQNLNQDLIIAGKHFKSRLMLGTGKYKTLNLAKYSIHASDTAIVTVAIRRLQDIKIQTSLNLIHALNWQDLWLLPNTAGCTTAEEAIRMASLGRELSKKIGQTNNNFIKLEVIPDSQYLFPDPIGTLKAAEYLVRKNFAVLPYIGQDPILAKQLEEIGCSTVMPLGSPIGSGQGLYNIETLQIIIENAKIPVVIDAGIGTPSDALKAMELGADALLINSAIARSDNPVKMAFAMKLAVESGRIAYLSGRMSQKSKAQASSPVQGIVH
uniref:Thiazole synthase n=1 Tax=Kumanoa americana TaxID=1196377 RepID=A0A1C9CGR6_9FLOR|nr:thiamin biosynthesis protein G [Kumanoa americana]AOM67564.1 thiamin biosynthesis protein G [Kumanoa americana]